MVLTGHKSFSRQFGKAVQNSSLKLALGSFFRHTSFMTWPPSAILVSRHSIFLLVLLRMDGNIACLLIQFSYTLIKTFIKTQGLLNMSILYRLIALVSLYSLDDLVLEFVPNERDVTDAGALRFQHE